MLHESSGYLRRDDRGRLLLRGEDRLSYLHGLLTNDVAALTPGSGCYAALLTPQGRMISDMRVFELGDVALLDLDRTVATVVRDHLDRFVITEDVVVEDVSDSLLQFAVLGPQAAATLAAAFAAGPRHDEPLPDSQMLQSIAPFGSRRWSFAGSPLLVLGSADLGLAGFDVIVPTDQADAFVEALEAAGGVAVTADTVDIVRIEAGIPRFGTDMDATTIPLEAGIEDAAISMTKGCYVGQEVIVRVLHRGGGRVARKLVSLRADAPVHRDDRILSGEREIGRITSAAASPRLGAIALGYVQRDFAEPGTEVTVRSERGLVRGRVVGKS